MELTRPDFLGIGAVFGVDATGAVFFNTAVPGSSCGGVFARAFCVCLRRGSYLGVWFLHEGRAKVKHNNESLLAVSLSEYGIVSFGFI